MTDPQMPSVSFSARYAAGSYAAGRTSPKLADVRNSSASFTKRSPVWMPTNDIVFLPSTYHQSPSASDTTVGALSPSSGTRPSHRSGGSMMCESDEIIHVVASTSAIEPVAAVVVMASHTSARSRRIGPASVTRAWSSRLDSHLALKA
jgi:hypothetical protein